MQPCRRIAMQEESVFVLNDIERQLAEDLIQELSAGKIPAKGRNDKHTVNYDYYSSKREQIVRGVILGCQYKLRYRDRNHIFFSAWDCTDVCGFFYDVVELIHVLTKEGEFLHVSELFHPFEVDLRTETYVFLATDVAASLVALVDFLLKRSHKVLYNSQYTLSIFYETDKSSYDALIQRFKEEGYSRIQILEVWIRGEVLYYAIVDGTVQRPQHQRILNSREEEDLIRKTYKTVNNKFKRMYMSKPE
jgi:hypothetical protein